METVQNKTSVKIKAKAQVVYNLITTPKNWVGLHPVTKVVYGPTIDKEAGVNQVWIEYIENSSDYHNSVDAMQFLENRLKKTANNEEFLISMND